MQALKSAISIAWIVFGVYWFASALGAKESKHGGRRIPLGVFVAASVVLLVRVFRGGTLGVHSPVLGGIGAALFALGIAIAVWARLYLGSNWGMPMTERVEPELVTSGPYQHVRHPIYTGLLLAILGTALATNLIGFAILVVLAGYFAYSARVEEKNLTAMFPLAYPPYRARTKMLIPFVL